MDRRHFDLLIRQIFIQYRSVEIKCATGNFSTALTALSGKAGTGFP
jgi:hypothetical protein